MSSFEDSVVSSAEIESIFLDASEISDEAERERLIRRRCGDRPILLSQVRELLLAGARPSILDSELPESVLVQSLLAGGGGQASFGHWRVRRLLGHGGMGSVYLAEQEEPVQRLAALKLIQLGQESDESIWRFQQEQQVLARLSHRHIAGLIDAAVQPSGVSWLAMEYVDGLPLSEWCDRHSATVEQRLELFLQCCEAIRHAHQNAIIHRDLKPSNILVAETPDGALVKVIDFGIARILNEADDAARTPSRRTRAGFLPGTPQYMSPEQWHGDVPVDTRTDVYSLGVVLYVLLTGSEPHLTGSRGQSLSQVAILQSILEQEAEQPSQRVLRQSVDGVIAVSDERRQLSRRLRGDLDAIVLKAMARERERRYQSVAELMTDLRCHLQNQPILARPDSRLYRLRRRVLQNRGLVAALFGVFLALSLGILMTGTQWRRAVDSESRLRLRNYCADLLLASLALDDGDTGNAVAALDRQRDVFGAAELDSLEYRLLTHLSASQVDELSREAKSLYYCCLLDEGRRLAVCGRSGELLILETGTGRQLHRVATGQGELNGLSLSPDGLRLAICGDDGTVLICDSATLVEQQRFRAHGAQVWQGAWSPDGGLLATCGNEKHVRIWETGTFTQRGLIESTVDLECLTGSSGGRLAIGGERSTLLLSSFPGFGGGGSERQEVQSGSAWLGRYFNLGAVSFSPAGDMLAAAEQGVSLRIARLDAGDSAVVSRQFADTVTALAFAPDGRSLAVGLGDGTVGTIPTERVHDAGLQLVLTGILHGAEFVSSDETELISSLQPAVVTTVPAVSGNRIPPGIRQLTLELSDDFPGAADPQSYRLYSALHTGITSATAFLMPVEVAVRGRQVMLTLPGSGDSESRAFASERRWKVHTKSVTSLAFAPGGQELYSVGEDGRVCVSRVSVVHPLQRVAEDIYDCAVWGQDAVLLTSGDVEGAQFQVGQIRDGRPVIVASRLPRVFQSPLLDELVWRSADHGREAWIESVAESGGWRLFERDCESSATREVWRSLDGELVRGVAGDTGGGRWLLLVESAKSGGGESARAADCEWRLYDEVSKKYVWRAASSGRGEFQLTADCRWLLHLDSPLVYVLDVLTGDLHTTENLQTEVAGISYLSSRQAFAVTHSDRHIRIYRCEDVALLDTISVTNETLADLAVSPDERTLLGITRSGLLKAWNTDSLLPTLSLKLPAENLFSLTVDPSGLAVWITDESGRCSVLSFAR